MRHGDTHHRAVVLAAGHLGLAARGRVALRGTVGVSSAGVAAASHAHLRHRGERFERGRAVAEARRGRARGHAVVARHVDDRAAQCNLPERGAERVQHPRGQLAAGGGVTHLGRRGSAEAEERCGRRREARARTTKLSMTSPLSTSVATLALTTSTPQARMCSERSARRPGRSLAVTVICCSPAGDSCTTTPVSRSSSLTDSIPVELQQRGQKKEGMSVLRGSVATVLRRLLCLVSSGSRCVSQH